MTTHRDVDSTVSASAVLPRPAPVTAQLAGTRDPSPAAREIRALFRTLHLHVDDDETLRLWHEYTVAAEYPRRLWSIALVVAVVALVVALTSTVLARALPIDARALEHGARTILFMTLLGATLHNVLWTPGRDPRERVWLERLRAAIASSSLSSSSSSSLSTSTRRASPLKHLAAVDAVHRRLLRPRLLQALEAAHAAGVMPAPPATGLYEVAVLRVIDVRGVLPTFSPALLALASLPERWLALGVGCVVVAVVFIHGELRLHAERSTMARELDAACAALRDR